MTVAMWPSIRVTAMSFTSRCRVFPSIYRTDDGGNTFRLETTGIIERDGLFIAPLAMDPSNPGVLWTGGRGPWRYDQQIARWRGAGFAANRGGFSFRHRYRAVG